MNKVYDVAIVGAGAAGLLLLLTVQSEVNL